MASKSRRAFLSGLGVAASAAGATLAAGSTAAHAQAATDSRWQAARHPQDDWFDQLPGKHRFFFDTTAPDKLEDALSFSGNFYSANKSVYGVENNELAVIICLRHRTAPFAYSDAIWAKYGATLAKRAEWTDPKSTETPKTNPFTPTAPAAPGRARGLAGAMKLGVQFAVCNLSTHGIASMIAGVTGGNADEIYKELAANLIGQARLVPAGIIAVNRAQERGYAITGS
jgi:intracellular sulfur oxidation DsrE/DsrF family protein